MFAKFPMLRRLIGAVRRRLVGAVADKTDVANSLDFVYRQYLGRAADPEELQRQISALRHGVPLSHLMRDIMASPAAQALREQRERDLAKCVDFGYRHCLGRAADTGELEHASALIRGGKPLSDVLDDIAASPEAEQRRRTIEHDAALSVDLGFWRYYGRAADAEGLQYFTALLKRGVSLALVLEGLKATPEAEQRRQNVERDFALCVDLIYWYCHGRAADAEGLQHVMAALRDAVPLHRVLEEIEADVKAEQRRQGLHSYFDELSDEQFILNIGELLFESGGATPDLIVHYSQLLGGDTARQIDSRARRVELVRNLINAHIDRQRQRTTVPWDSHQCWLMGTKYFITPAVWRYKAAQLAPTAGGERTPRPLRARSVFAHSGDYVVSAIASLYKGARYIENFLDNITSQTIFDRCELIIIDADSPEGEQEVIAEYQKIYPNIVYKRMNYRIGVYDAWNVGIGLARGKYLTNTNLDDLRRRDSFELQANALDANPFADVVYQDFFYSFDASLGFDEVARVGVKSDVPIITANNLLAFNSPHNAPMWRKALHDELGLFDTSFASAGDWEFWLRCLERGKKFLKINAPHVVYFMNPEGLSTGETRKIREQREILRRYCRKLISAHLLLSRQQFADLLGISPDWDAATSYYDVVQGQLRRVGERYKGGIGGKPGPLELSAP